MNTSEINNTKEWRMTPSHSQVFMFSAITWNRHQIHFDFDQAVAEGLSNIVVQRGLIGNFLARFLKNWIGPTAQLERLRWKVLKSVFPDHELRFYGRINKISKNLGFESIECSLTIFNPTDSLVVEGQAEMRLIP